MKRSFRVGWIKATDKRRNQDRSVFEQLGLADVCRPAMGFGKAAPAARMGVPATLSAFSGPVLRSFHCHTDNGSRIKKNEKPQEKLSHEPDRAPYPKIVTSTTPLRLRKLSLYPQHRGMK